uniref:hypothetical protein n=1 Tax=Acetatifactor sp. TaxID=1872090 RepID=UPI0040575539
MKKKIVINSILFLLFCAGLFVLLERTNFVLRHKEYAGVQDKFAQLPEDSVDLVFVGSSHQFCSINPDLLFYEYGVESFMLATSAQTVPMSYYAAMEAIELQHPDTIVFEVSYCANDFRTVTDEMSHCFFDGMPDCEARQLAIEDLIEEEQQIYYYLPLGLYHTRWKELTEADFGFDQFSDRGGVFYDRVEVNTQIPLLSEEETAAMPEEMEKYMDKLVALCEENDVKLILYTAPFNTLYEADYETESLYNRQRIFNDIGEYAKEKEIEYHNLFYEIEEIGLDAASDWMDRQHLNCYGQEKFTRYMMEKGYLE